MTCPLACRFFRAVRTGTRPGLTPAIWAVKGWRGRRESDSQVFCHPIRCMHWRLWTNILVVYHRPHHHHHHKAYDSSTRFLVCVTVMIYNPADGSCAERASGAARRWRERRLRSWLKHERQTVRMVLAETFHHSSAPFPPKFKEEWVGRHEQHAALRGPKTARTKEATHFMSRAREPELFSLVEEPGGGPAGTSV